MQQNPLQVKFTAIAQPTKLVWFKNSLTLDRVLVGLPDDGAWFADDVSDTIYVVYNDKDGNSHVTATNWVFLRLFELFVRETFESAPEE